MNKLNKIKISVVIPSLCAGGAERVMSFVAQELNPEIFDTTLVVFGFEKDAAYEIKNIKTCYFNKPRVLTGILAFYKHIKQNKPDIVFTAIGHLNTIGAYFSKIFRNTKFVAREVNVLSVLEQFHKKQPLLNKIISNRRFQYFDAIVCQSQDMKNDLTASYKLKQDNLVVINNPITDGFSPKSSASQKSPIQFITVARLAKQKGHKRILEALSKLPFIFEYTLVGSGGERENLVAQANKLGISQNLKFVPFTNQVHDFLAKSDVYLQGSYVEGFPNALLESCMVGTPVIAFNAPGGINEIIITGTNGYIAENEGEFINFLKQYKKSGLPNPKVVSDSVYSRYNKQLIISQYENLFKGLVS